MSVLASVSTLLRSRRSISILVNFVTFHSTFELIKKSITLGQQNMNHIPPDQHLQQSSRRYGIVVGIIKSIQATVGTEPSLQINNRNYTALH
jgi:hypothetical protein